MKRQRNALTRVEYNGRGYMIGEGGTITLHGDDREPLATIEILASGGVRLYQGNEYWESR